MSKRLTANRDVVSFALNRLPIDTDDCQRSRPAIVSSPSELELTWPVERALCTERGGAYLLSTPSLILLMERTAVRLVEHLLGPNETTVGTKISAEHRAPTPEGSTVRVRATILNREGRFIELQIEAFDELDQVGIAEHQRAIVDVERYTARLRAKLEKLAELGGSSST